MLVGFSFLVFVSETAPGSFRLSDVPWFGGEEDLFEVGSIFLDVVGLSFFMSGA